MTRLNQLGNANALFGATYWLVPRLYRVDVAPNLSDGTNQRRSTPLCRMDSGFGECQSASLSRSNSVVLEAWLSLMASIPALKI